MGEGRGGGGGGGGYEDKYSNLGIKYSDSLSLIIISLITVLRKKYYTI